MTRQRSSDNIFAEADTEAEEAQVRLSPAKAQRPNSAAAQQASSRSDEVLQATIRFAPASHHPLTAKGAKSYLVQRPS